MKKLLLVLMVVAMASFLFVGCLPGVTPPDEEGEDEGVTEVTVDIAKSVVIDGKTYVKSGAHDITVTFPEAVVGNVEAKITLCTGDYTKDLEDLNWEEFFAVSVPLFPDATRKIWTGSGKFTATGPNECCASYVEVISGVCEADVCIKFPVIVDGGKPFAKVKVSIDGCYCGDCKLTFKSAKEVCDEVCCGDDCSGLASWSFKLYEGNPFGECCDATCEEPYDTCSGTTCPIECTTKCLDAEDYYVIATLADEVGNKVTEYGNFKIVDSTCKITYRYGTPITGATEPPCVTWGSAVDYDSVKTIEFFGKCVNK